MSWWLFRFRLRTFWCGLFGHQWDVWQTPGCIGPKGIESTTWRVRRCNKCHNVVWEDKPWRTAA